NACARLVQVAHGELRQQTIGIARGEQRRGLLRVGRFDDAAQFLQLGQQFARRLIALLALFADRFGDNRAQGGRNVRTELARVRRFSAVEQCGDLLFIRLAVERPPRAEHLEYYDAERKNICASVKLAFATRLLRRSVAWRVKELPGLGLLD